jgi:hypothetical protein
MSTTERNRNLNAVPIRIGPLRNAAKVTLSMATTGAIVLGLSGCVSQRAALPRKDLLDFLVDGRTLCSDVTAHLGTPSQSYQDGRLITYRIAEDGKGRFAVVFSPAQEYWIRANQSLVITCGSDGVVTRHALVAMKQGKEG